MTKRKSFTLTELVVVIASIGLMIALLLPAIKAAQKAANGIVTEREAKHAQAIKSGEYVKDFEDMGNGIYHVAPSEYLGIPQNMTRDFAAILSTWRVSHPNRRVVSVIETNGRMIVVAEDR